MAGQAQTHFKALVTWRWENDASWGLQGFGDVAVNIFCREAQEVWEELFPFADDRSLKLAAEHGLPDQAAQLAELVGNDRHKFVRLLAALIRSNLRKVPVDDESGTVDSGGVSPAFSCLLCLHAACLLTALRHVPAM